MTNEEILEQLAPDNIPLQKQVDLLVQYLMGNFEGARRNESAIELAVRLLQEYRNARPIPIEKIA